MGSEDKNRPMERVKIMDNSYIKKLSFQEIWGRDRKRTNQRHPKDRTK